MEAQTLASYAQNPKVLLRARDLYAAYCASADGKNYQGLPCPSWDTLTEAVRGHWYTTALRSLRLSEQDRLADRGMCDARTAPPGEYETGHLLDATHAIEVWRRYSGL